MTKLTYLLEASTRSKVIIESPCSGDMNRNADYLRRCLRHSIARGEAPIASHGLLAFSSVLDEHDAAQRHIGMLCGWVWIEVADRMVIYVDLGITPGMKQAMDIAEELGIPVETRRIGHPPITEEKQHGD